jgi:hypothetical protein
VQSSDTFTAGSAVFDEQNLVSSAGLVPVLELAEQTGLSRLIGEHVDLPSTWARFQGGPPGRHADLDPCSTYGCLVLAALLPGQDFYLPLSPS